MKRIILLFAAVLCFFSACNPTTKKVNLSEEIIGTWSLIDIQLATKAASIGSESINIDIIFNADNTFELSQQIGQGRPVIYNGTWSLTETILSGKYSDGTDWASSYKIEISDKTTLTMIVEPGASDIYVYKKK